MLFAGSCCSYLGTKSEDGDQRRLVEGCAGGMHGMAARKLKAMQSRFEARGGMGGVRFRRGSESCWHAGQHDLPQDESKCVKAGGELGLRSSTAKWRGTTCKVPCLHWGQDRLSADFCCSVSSALMSGMVALRWILQRVRARWRMRLASSPKWRILTKPEGRTWSRKRRMNSTASSFMTLLRLLCRESLQRKRTCPLSRLSSLPLEMATRWV